MDDTEVLIAGAGPVGITLAMCLAQRGIRSLVIEPKAPDTLPDVKCNHVSARSMELYRRLGVADALRAISAEPVGVSGSGTSESAGPSWRPGTGSTWR